MLQEKHEQGWIKKHTSKPTKNPSRELWLIDEIRARQECTNSMFTNVPLLQPQCENFFILAWVTVSISPSPVERWALRWLTKQFFENFAVVKVPFSICCVCPLSLGPSLTALFALLPCRRPRWRFPGTPFTSLNDTELFLHLLWMEMVSRWISICLNEWGFSKAPGHFEWSPLILLYMGENMAVVFRNGLRCS